VNGMSTFEGPMLSVKSVNAAEALHAITPTTARVGENDITGEWRLATVTVGQRVYAGTVHVESPLRVQVEQAGESPGGPVHRNRTRNGGYDVRDRIAAQ